MNKEKQRDLNKAWSVFRKRVGHKIKQIPKVGLAYTKKDKKKFAIEVKLASRNRKEIERLEREHNLGKIL